MVPLQDPQDFGGSTSRRESCYRRSRTCGRQEKSSRRVYCHDNFSGFLRKIFYESLMPINLKKY
jgi:hypothetical protein